MSGPATSAAGGPVAGGPAAGGPGRGGAFAVKRGLDVVLSLALLAAALPALLVLGLAVRVQLRRPALFRQVRVVGRGREAEIVKLRTLPAHGDPDTCWAAPEQGATRLCRFMRATHLDELPQLINVLRGEMSLVGPRPERPYFARRFAEEVPGYAGRLRVKAGLTGWAQVNGLNGDTSIAARAVFDNTYIDNWSLRLDLVILARTAGAALAAAFGCAPAAARTGPAPGQRARAPLGRSPHAPVPAASGGHQ